MRVRLGKHPKNPDKGRKLEVQIDDWDVWSLDHTLALVIHPALVKLKEVKHGSPDVDDEDVPEELRSTSAPAKENEWDTDANWHKRWEWVLDEMIHAFSQHARGDWAADFHHNTDELDIEFSEEGGITFIENGYYYDSEGAALENARIANGRRLFAKYYDGLWD